MTPVCLNTADLYVVRSWF